MDDSTYIDSKTIHMHDTLSIGSPHSQDTHLSATQSSAGYGPQDMNRSFTNTSVTSFSPYPAYDTSLPTPISIAASPPMSERARKMAPAYNQHEEGAQSLSPPPGSRPWSYMPNMTGASPAAMTVPVTTSEMLSVHAMDPTSSPEQQPAALNPTPHFHWAEYTVSSHDANDDLPQGHHMFAPNIPPSALLRSPHFMAGSHVPLAQAVQHGSLPPHPTGGQPLMPHEMHHPYGNELGNIPLEYVQTYPSRKTARAKAGRSSRPAKRIRTSRTSFSRVNGDDYDNEATAAMAGNALRAKQGGATPPSLKFLDLRPDAPEDGRYLVEMRCRLSEDKGKGMWEQIRQAFHERFGQLKTKENLQMLLIRTVQKYAIWPEEETQALKAAVDEYEKRRYSEIRKIMKERGGRRVWDWNDGCIAKQLVMLGVDEVDNSCPKKVRRKRKHAARETAGGEAWTAVPNNPFNTDPRILTHGEEEMLMQAFCKPDPGTPQPDHLAGVGGANSPAAPSQGPDRNTCQNRSARVAKQACEQMITRQGEQPYSGHGQYVP